MTFESARLKTRRADDHLVALNDCVQRFVKSEPYAIYAEKDPDTREHILLLKVLKPPRLDEWAIQAGDVLHNLRSALDHVIWELTCRKLGTPPYPLTEDWVRVEFPIFREKRAYLYGRQKKTARNLGCSGSGLYKIRSIDKRLHALVKSLQPFRDGPRRDRNLLQVIHELDLIDKHRSLPVLLSVVVPMGATITGGPFEEMLELKVVEVFKPGPFQDGTPLARVEESGAWHITAYALPMHVQPQLSFDVKLQEGRPTMGLSLLPELSRMVEHVNEILDLFESKLAG